ncbi:hypothetical protein B0H21DRAFT_162742 [Amylocystis lapponica]|nr:hypothetical protein B0H21DRAFT_162742 [Amylocystis lapponica]
MAALQAVKHFRVRTLAPLLKADAKATSARSKIPSPFLPHKNPDTGRWAPPKYSLRQQADLVKSARACNSLHLLPVGPKFTLRDAKQVASTATATGAASQEAWMQEVQWEGKQKAKVVKGADVGNRLYAGKKRMFKGHKWERVRERVEQRRSMLMKGMPKRVERFKTNYNRKRPNPLSVPRNTSYTKLPY